MFLDDSQLGTPTDLADGLLGDISKHWLPDVFAGGFVRWGGSQFAIVSNTATMLTVTGDPSLLTDDDNFGYRIVSPAVIRLIDYFAQHDIPVVQTSYAQIPTEVPCFTIALHEDNQGQAYWNESMESKVAEGLEYQENFTHITGQYMVSIWTTNRVETLWLAAWLTNLYVGGQQQLSSWGFADVNMVATDLHPALQFLPERMSVRSFMLTALRPERAVNLLTLEAIDHFHVTAYPAYATIRVEEPLP